MKTYICTIALFFLLSFSIESTENDPISSTLKHGQCTKIGNVLTCESKDTSVSVQFKTLTQL